MLFLEDQDWLGLALNVGKWSPTDCYVDSALFLAATILKVTVRLNTFNTMDSKENTDCYKQRIEQLVPR